MTTNLCRGREVELWRKERAKGAMGSGHEDKNHSRDNCPEPGCEHFHTRHERHFSSFEVCNHNRASKEDGSNDYKERSRGYRVFQYTPNKNELIGSQTEHADAIIKREVFLVILSSISHSF